jgi:hypothetical protein
VTPVIMIIFGTLLLWLVVTGRARAVMRAVITGA